MKGERKTKVQISKQEMNPSDNEIEDAGSRQVGNIS